MFCDLLCNLCHHQKKMPKRKHMREKINWPEKVIKYSSLQAIKFFYLFSFTDHLDRDFLSSFSTLHIVVNVSNSIEMRENVCVCQEVCKRNERNDTLRCFFIFEHHHDNDPAEWKLWGEKLKAVVRFDKLWCWLCNVH